MPPPIWKWPRTGPFPYRHHSPAAGLCRRMTSGGTVMTATRRDRVASVPAIAAVRDCKGGLAIKLRPLALDCCIGDAFIPVCVGCKAVDCLEYVCGDAFGNLQCPLQRFLDSWEGLAATCFGEWRALAFKLYICCPGLGVNCSKCFPRLKSFSGSPEAQLVCIFEKALVLGAKWAV